MNTQTKKALQEFCEQVKVLAAAVVLTIGSETCIQVVNAAENLKLSLDDDETIKESR
jgi:hypothetical protein